MLAAARVTLKQHRFEIVVAVLAAIAAGVVGISILVRIDALGVTQACLNSAQASRDGSGLTADCLDLVGRGQGIIGDTYLSGQGTVALSIMGALPFLLGLLGGVPIVSRELEARTAQTAWSLNPSRFRWLGRQIAPVALLLGVPMLFAALVATPVGEDWVRWGRGGRSDLIGLHGLLAAVRAFGAFGIGLAVGAFLGRTLPAFILGLALTLAILLGLSLARDAWLAGLPREIIGPTSAGAVDPAGPGAKTTGLGWIAPDGETLSREEARQLATDAGVPSPDPHDAQDTPAGVWLEAHGYFAVPLGVTDATALGWAPYDGLTFAMAGFGGLGATVLLVHRRRPA